ncbi:hypothetical protein GQ54DRAFT_2510 [Martensiomyces pterosporus]|nr:hypothetical protein GQ54DRAFT_2510 [Martensiomyces pterosporus]
MTNHKRRMLDACWATISKDMRQPARTRPASRPGREAVQKGGCSINHTVKEVWRLTPNLRSWPSGGGIPCGACMFALHAQQQKDASFCEGYIPAERGCEFQKLSPWFAALIGGGCKRGKWKSIEKEKRTKSRAIESSSNGKTEGIRKMSLRANLFGRQRKEERRGRGVN